MYNLHMFLHNLCFSFAQTHAHTKVASLYTSLEKVIALATPSEGKGNATRPFCLFTVGRNDRYRLRK